MKDWAPILISSLALGFSVYATYIKDLRRKSVVKYREAWDAHQTPSFSGTKFGDFTESVQKHIGYNLQQTIFLLYTISLTNFGDKESDEITIHLTNLPADLKIRESLFDEPPDLVWEPTTHKAPKIDNQKILVDPLPVGSTITLRIFQQLDRKRKEISFALIPRAGKIYNGDKQALGVSEAHTNLISLKDVQRKIQKELDQINTSNA